MNILRYRWTPSKLAPYITRFLGGQVEIGFDNLELTLEELRNLHPVLRGHFTRLSMSSSIKKEVIIECAWLCEQIIEPDDNGKLKARWKPRLIKNNIPHELTLRYSSFYPQPDEERLKLKWGEEAIHFYLPTDISNLVNVKGEYIPFSHMPESSMVRNLFGALLIRHLKLKPLAKQ